MSAAARRAQLLRSTAIIERFAYALWPKCFVVLESRRPPLALGIDRDLIRLCQPAIDKGLVTAADLRRALRYYTGSVGYLKNCIEGAARIDLLGRPAGQVSRSEAEYAERVLAERRAKRANSSSPAGRAIRSLQPAGTPHVETERPSANPQFANGPGTIQCMGTLMAAPPARK